jgi:hypothetical protein
MAEQGELTFHHIQPAVEAEPDKLEPMVPEARPEMVETALRLLFLELLLHMPAEEQEQIFLIHRAAQVEQVVVEMVVQWAEMALRIPVAAVVAELKMPTQAAQEDQA